MKRSETIRASSKFSFAFILHIRRRRIVGWVMELICALTMRKPQPGTP
jgi:hypothetical protein